MENSSSGLPAQQPAATDNAPNWRSGWRLGVAVLAGVIGAKLFGAAGVIAAVAVFYGLQPRKGTAFAAIVAAIVGTLVSVGLTVAFLQGSAQQTQPAQSAPAVTAPAAVPHANEDGPWKQYQGR